MSSTTLGRFIRKHVFALFSAKSSGRLEKAQREEGETSGYDLELMNERLHLGLHLLSNKQSNAEEAGEAVSEEAEDEDKHRDPSPVLAFPLRAAAVAPMVYSSSDEKPTSWPSLSNVSHQVGH